ncbi:MAG: RNA methyltransferase [Candidatus Margulisiibacteriota bacterium]
MIEPIKSTQNETLKSVGKLHYKKQRDTTGLFVIEGRKEIEFALIGGFDLESLWVVSSHLSTALQLVKQHHLSCKLYEITASCFEKIGYRETSEGLLAVGVQKHLTLEAFLPLESSLVIIADNIEKPGNLGALFRVADGVGAQAVILSGRQDVYNPNVVRSSVGTLFSVPFFEAQTPVVSKELSLKNFTLIAADPHCKTNFGTFQYPKRTALIIGSEHSGVSEEWAALAEQRVTIPMHGKNDSLNLSVSAGILAYAWRLNHP